MGRVNAYPNVTRPAKTDEFLIDGSGGTRNVSLENAAIEMAGMISTVQHCNIWRGKNLGSTFTDAQKTAISDGTFDDLYIGDYWAIGDVNYRIVDIDYWFGQGDTNCITHHLVVMPDGWLYDHVMNDEATTTGGYMLSKMRLEGLDEAKQIINSVFGEANILKHREFLTNAVVDGHASAMAWDDSTVELPNEVMMYGCYMSISMDRASESGSVPTKTVDKTQLAGMRLYPRLIDYKRHNTWLRDVSSSIHFSGIGSQGHATSYNASNRGGVRPVFGLTGGN